MAPIGKLRGPDSSSLSDLDFRRIVDGLPLGVTVKGPDGRILYTNAADAALHGYQEQEVIGQHARIFGVRAARQTVAAAAGPESDGPWLRSSWNARSSGETFPVQLRSNSVRDGSGGVVGVVTTCEDLSERERIEGTTTRRSMEDGLTGLASRSFFLELVNRAIARLERHTDYRFAVLYINLRRFRLINESLGYDRGDLVLQASALGLKAAIRPADVAARIAGDEFAILLDGLANLTDATRVAERIGARFDQPLQLEDGPVEVSACIGIAVSGKRQTGEEYISDARIAMARARTDDAPFEVFDPALHQRAVERLSLENDLRLALQRDQLRAVYQPIVDLKTGKVTGFEALVRWDHPTRGAIPPSAFIPLAEETGLVVSIGAWMLQTASMQLADWLRRFPRHPDLSMNVNLSVRQLRRHDVVQQVSRTLAETGLPARHLKIEVTESMLMENADAQVELLGQLRNLGVGVAIDDFGTGYSSLSYLQRFPIDALKIDRSFIARENGGDSWDIVRMIIALARDKRALSVAEGVETAEQARELRDMGCDRAQGYFYAPPLNATDTEAMLRG